MGPTKGVQQPKKTLGTFWDPIQNFAPFHKVLPKNTRGPEFSQSAQNFRQSARTDGQLTGEDRTKWRGGQEGGITLYPALS